MKHKFIAKRYWKDQSTAMGQSDEMAKSFDDVINLSLGDPDMTTPELIIEAAFRDAKAGHTKYTDFRGDPELRAEICRYYEKNFGMPVRDEEVFVTASSCPGHLLLRRCRGDPAGAVFHAVSAAGGAGARHSGGTGDL